MEQTNQGDNCRKQKTMLRDDSPEGEVNLDGHSQDEINPKQKTKYELMDKLLDHLKENREKIFRLKFWI